MPRFPDDRLLGGFCRDLIHGPLTGRIPCWQGKKQGISAIQPFSANIRLENICESSDLRANSLRDEQGIYLREQGISVAEQGIWREIDPRAPNSLNAEGHFCSG